MKNAFMHIAKSPSQMSCQLAITSPPWTFKLALNPIDSHT